jgi:hypothetical protein
MSNCYRTGGCGPYENLACNECPASKSSYKDRYFKLFVGTIEGENKDSYMAIGKTEKEVKERLVNKFFEDELHNEKDLEELGSYIVVHIFENNTKAIVF